MADEYVDEQGNPVDLNSIDKNDWEVVSVQDKPSASWWDVAKALPEKAATSLSHAIGGKLQSAEENPSNLFRLASTLSGSYGPDTEVLANLLSEIPQTHVGQTLEKKAEDVQAPETKRLNLEPGSWKDLAYNVGGDLLPTLPLLAAGAPPSMLAPIFGGISGGEHYANARAHGVAPGTALTGQLADEALTTGTSSLPLGFAASPETGLVKRAANVTGSNLLISPIQSAYEYLAGVVEGQYPFDEKQLAHAVQQSEKSALISSVPLTVAGEFGGHAERGNIDAEAQKAIEQVASQGTEGLPATEPPPVQPGQSEGISSESLLPKTTAEVGDAGLPPSDSALTTPPESDQTANLLPSTEYTPESSSALGVLDTKTNDMLVSHYNDTIKQAPWLESFAASVAGDAPVDPINIKMLERAQEKLATKISEKPYTPQDLPDLIRTTIYAKDSAQAGDILKRIMNSPEYVSAEDYLRRPTDKGFEGINVNVRAPNGALAELQIHTPETIAIKKALRSTYETLRVKGETPYGELIGDLTRAREIAAEARSKFRSQSLVADDTGAQTLADPQALRPARFPVERIASSEIVSRPKVMQFKQGADETTGITAEDKITGSRYDELKGGVLLVYEPKPENRAKYGMKAGEKYIIANGHHRFEFGNRVGADAYNVQVLREADGYTPEKARRTAAEINIADGKGTIYDQVKFLSNAAKTEGKETALQLANDLGTKPQRARAIAFGSTDSTLGLFFSQKITPAQAEAVAGIAPGDAAKQEVALGEALKGTSPDSIRSYMAAREALENDPTFKPQQSSFFSGESARDLESQETTRTQWALNEMKSEARRQVKAAANASNDPETAKEMGIDVANPSATEEQVKQARFLLENANKFYLFPEIKARVSELKKIFPLNGDAKGSVLSNERGVNQIIPDLLGKAEDYLTDSDIKRLEAEFGGKLTYEGLPEAEKFFRGDILGSNVPVISQLRAGFHRRFSYPLTLGRKFPEFMPIPQAELEAERGFRAVSNEAGRALKPYFALPLKERVFVDKFLFKMRDLAQSGNPPAVKATVPEVFRKGLEAMTPAQREAVTAVRNTMDVVAPRLMREALYARNNGQDPTVWKAKVDDFVDRTMAVSQYVPYGRFGDKYLAVFDKEGTLLEYSFNEKVGPLRERAKEALKNGHDAKIGDLLRPTQEAYDSLPANLLGGLASLDPDAPTKLGENLPVRGFSSHLVHAKNVAGYEQNLSRGIAEYIVGLANYHSRSIAKPKFQAGLEGITRNPELYGAAKRYIDYVSTRTPEGQKLKQFLSLYYLGGNFKTAAVNLTQMLAVTYPELAKYTKSPAATWLKAQKLVGGYLLNRGSFSERNPELAEMFHRAMDDGTISDNMFRELTGRAGGYQKGTSPADILMFGFGQVEKLNRLHAFSAGYLAGKEKGLTGADLENFSRDFVNDTQFVYSKGNRPEIARGYGALPFLFRTGFNGNWLALLRRNMPSVDLTNRLPQIKGGESFGAGMRMIGVMMALGGIASLPLVKDMLNGLEVAGYDPKKHLKESLGNNAYSKALEYGVPHGLGLGNLSGTIGLGEFVPDIEKGPVEAINRSALGVLSDFFFGRPARSAWLYSIGEKGRAVEALLPEALRNAAVAARVRREKGFITPYGINMVPNPTALELGEKALGFQPSRLTEAYDESHTIDLLKKRIEDARGHINLKIAKAIDTFIKTGDKSGITDAIDSVRELNTSLPPAEKVNIDSGAIKTYLAAMLSKKVSELRSVPKEARPEVVEIWKLFEDNQNGKVK